MPDLLVRRGDFQLERRDIILAALGAFVPAETEQTGQQFDKFMAWRERAQQRLICAFDLGARDRLAELLATTMAADIVGIFAIAALHPICGHGMVATTTIHETAQREIRAHIDARGRVGFAGEPILIALEGFQRDHAFMLPLAKRDAPHLAFDMSGIDRIGQDAIGLLIGEEAVTADGKARMAFHEAFDFGARVEAPGGIAIESFADDRGDRFNTHEDRTTSRRFFVAIAERRMEHPIAAEHTPFHPVLCLFGIFPAMLAGERRFHDFEKIVVGIIRINAARRFQHPADRRYGVADRVVRPHRTREAVEIVDQDDGAFPLGRFQKRQKFLESVAVDGFAGEVVTENRNDIIALAVGIIPAHRFLTFEAVPFLGLPLGGNAAVDNGFLFRGSCHGLGAFGVWFSLSGCRSRTVPGVAYS